MAAHDLNDCRAVMGAAGGADGADILHAGVDGAVVAEGHLGVVQVVVDRTGDAHAGDAQVAKRLRALEGAVAADDHDALNAHLADIVGSLKLHFGAKEFQAARGAQIGARLIGDIKNGIQIQFGHVLADVLVQAERAIVAALDAKERHAVVARSLRNRHYGGVHARRVSAGGQYTDSLHIVLLSAAGDARRPPSLGAVPIKIIIPCARWASQYPPGGALCAKSAKNRLLFHVRKRNYA